MAEPEATQPINLNDWMKEQPVSPFQVFRACCSPTKFRRRLARLALFKRITMQELERRYQKQQPRLSHKENQAIRQTIEKFKNGWYIGVSTRHSIGTFYSPHSFLFTLLVMLAMRFRTQPSYLLPCASYIIKSFFMKDNYKILFAYMMLVSYPLLVFWDIFWFVLFMTILLLVILLLFLPIELVLFIGGLCRYGCSRRRNLGVFVYHCKLSLIIAYGSATKTHAHGSSRTVRLANVDQGAVLTLPRASLCRAIFNNPISRIFENLYWLEYSYGNIADYPSLSTREVEMYKLRLQQSAILQAKAKRLA